MSCSPSDYALIVTADHGQCPLPDDVDGVRLDPVAAGEAIDRRFGGELVTTVQSVVPSEIYLHEGVLRVNGASIDDVAVGLRDYRYRQNIGPYVPAERDRTGPARRAGVLSGVLHHLPGLARGRATCRCSARRRSRMRDPDGIPEIP